MLPIGIGMVRLICAYPRCAGSSCSRMSVVPGRVVGRWPDRAGSCLPGGDCVSNVGRVIDPGENVHGVGGGQLPVPVPECSGGEPAHGGGQPSGDALRIADVLGVLTQRQPGRLCRVVAFLRGEPVAAADAVQPAGVAVGQLGNIQRGTWCLRIRLEQACACPSRMRALLHGRQPSASELR